MVTTVNNLGGSSGFTYTELNGLGLNATATTSAKNDAAIQNALAQEVLDALPELRRQGVLNPTWADIKEKIDFSKVFADPDALLAYPSLSTQTDKLQEVFNRVAAGRPHLNLEHWGNFAGNLQDDAAKKQSFLRVGEGGGIIHVNGHWYANGERISLNQLNFTLRANQYSAIDTEIADQLTQVQANNEKAKKAKEFKDVWDRVKADLDNGTLAHDANGSFSGTTISGSSTYVSGTNYASVAAAATSTDIETLAPKFFAQHGHTVHFDNIDDLLTELGTYLSSNSSDNQVAQQRLERLNNQRIAVLEGLTSFTKGQSDSFNQISRNL
jgi:hypothetical protein